MLSEVIIHRSGWIESFLTIDMSRAADWSDVSIDDIQEEVRWVVMGLTFITCELSRVLATCNLFQKICTFHHLGVAVNYNLNLPIEVKYSSASFAGPWYMTFPLARSIMRSNSLKIEYRGW